MGRTITYRFEFDDAAPWEYALHFDDHQRYIAKPTAEIKQWTRLEFKKCGHCPLQSATHPQCPIAQNLDRVVEDSKGTLSIKRAKVTVVTPERTYVKECATQDGLRSLFGVIMACSGCPHMDWLRPLARFHLPFADSAETIFRVLSLQLIEDLLFQNEPSHREHTRTLQERYQQVERVNHTFIERIRSYCQADADKNAIAALDVFVQLFPYHLEDNFKVLRKLWE